jgi:CPA2 family monovalent cation:H+ antiporter-2
MEEVAKNADLISVLYKCLLVFGIAGLIVPIFNRIHISPVLGFLVCGVMLSPNLLSTFDLPLLVDEKNVKLLGELGVLALLFMIGLELSYEKLAELKRYIFGLGTAQILVTGIVITGIAFLFNNSLQASIVIGIGFALSSTAIVMQSLKDYGMMRRSVGKMGFSILLMQDMAVVPILVMRGLFAGNADNSSDTPLLIIYSFGGALIAVALIYFIGKRILQPILHKLIGTNKNEWIAAFALFVLCGIAIITQEIGLSAALGAFLAGLLIAETEFRDKIEEILYPVKSILLGVFFISIGMMVNIFEVMSNPVLLSVSVIGILLVKGLTLYPLCRLFGIKHPYARDMSVMLCQPGEFTLMIISLSLAVGLLPQADAQFFLLVTVLGMLITPFIFRFIPTVRHHNS